MLDPARLEDALAVLRRLGYTPVLVADDAEAPEFRARFETAAPRAIAGLTPVGGAGRARVYTFEH
jgi:hypothetical protein